MDEENKEKIRSLANLTKEDVGYSEEDVKINLIVPLFEAFGHKRMRFEHRWKDALIERLDPTCKIVIETKRYDKSLDREIQQLKNYCDEERPLLGIIANGKEIRIFSYFWRVRPTFQESLIYWIKRKDLKDEDVIQRLENILSITNLESGKAKKFVIEREIEIENLENKIKEIEKDSNEKVKQVQVKIDDLTHKVDDIKKQIEEYKYEKEKITKETKEQISQIYKNLGFPQPTNRETIPQSLKRSDKSKGGYRESYRKQLEDPKNLISKILRYIQEQREVTYAELKNACVSQFGCKSKTSGSIGASVTTLKDEGYIKIEGRGYTKRLIYLKKE